MVRIKANQINPLKSAQQCLQANPEAKHGANLSWNCGSVQTHQVNLHLNCLGLSPNLGRPRYEVLDKLLGGVSSAAKVLTQNSWNFTDGFDPEAPWDLESEPHDLTRKCQNMALSNLTSYFWTLFSMHQLYFWVADSSGKSLANYGHGHPSRFTDSLSKSLWHVGHVGSEVRDFFVSGFKLNTSSQEKNIPMFIDSTC